MSDKKERARKLFDDGFSCSQSVFTPYAVEQGLPEEKALKLSQVLGGGISHMGLTCGAVTGALLVISLHFGRSQAEDLAAQEFCRRFTELHGSINCSDLIGCSLKTSQGRELASEHDLFDKYCTVFIEDSCRLLEEIIEEGYEKKERSKVST